MQYFHNTILDEIRDLQLFRVYLGDEKGHIFQDKPVLEQEYTMARDN